MANGSTGQCPFGLATMSGVALYHGVIVASDFLGAQTPEPAAARRCKTAKDCVIRRCCCSWGAHHKKNKLPEKCRRKCRCRRPDVVEPARPNAACRKGRCVAVQAAGGDHDTTIGAVLPDLQHYVPWRQGIRIENVTRPVLTRRRRRHQSNPTLSDALDDLDRDRRSIHAQATDFRTDPSWPLSCSEPAGASELPSINSPSIRLRARPGSRISGPYAALPAPAA